MGKLLVTPPWPPLVRQVAERMRRIDRVECTAMYGNTVDPANMVLNSVRNSTRAWGVRTALGEPVAVFGVAPFALLGSIGAAWMIGTDAVERYPRELLTLGREYVERMHESYDELCNFVWAEHESSLRWLARLGFELGPAQPLGVGQHLFHHARRMKTRCATQVS